MSALFAIWSGAEAAYYDFSDTGNSVQINQGILANPANDTIVGTGYFNPFIRTQVPGNGGVCGKDCEEGYNTNAPTEFETKDDGDHNWTHAVRYDDLEVVTGEDGQTYHMFLLDINEPAAGDKSYLSLDVLQFFVSDNENLTGYDRTTQLFSSQDATVGNGSNETVNSPYFEAGANAGERVALAWEMDRYVYQDVVVETGTNNKGDTTYETIEASRANSVANLPTYATTNPYDGDGTQVPEMTPNELNPGPWGENNAIRLEYILNNGSGKGIDLVALIPTLAFTSAMTAAGITDYSQGYITLFNRFGDVNSGTDAEAGFEEWAYLSKASQEPWTPEISLPGTLLMLIGCLPLLRWFSGRERADRLAA